MIDIDSTTGPADFDEQRGRALVRAASADVRAPLGLRERLTELERHPRPRRAWFGVRGLVLAGGLAVAAVVLTVAMGSTPAPTLGEAEALAASVRADRPLTGPATALGISLPADVEGWSAVGTATAHAGERALEVVSYQTPKGADVRYAVIDGAPLAVPAGQKVDAGGRQYVIASLNGRTAVTWRQQGKTCVLTVAAGVVPVDRLLAAARQGPT